MISYEIKNMTIHLSGKTYDFKETIKSIGGKWDRENKIWKIPSRPENIELVKSMITKKTIRTCGWCGEPGHTQTKCALKLTQISERLMRNPGPHFKKLNGTLYCRCHIIDVNISGVSIPFPKTCHNCKKWCCKLAIPNGNLEFICSVHGSSVEQFLNNTKGT